MTGRPVRRRARPEIEAVAFVKVDGEPPEVRRTTGWTRLRYSKRYLRAVARQDRLRS